MSIAAVSVKAHWIGDQGGAAERFFEVGGGCPALAAQIGFNGKESARFEGQFRELGLRDVHPALTSPAYTLSFEAKLERWRRRASTALSVTAQIRDRLF